MRNADMPATPIVSASGTAFNMGANSDGSPLRTTGLSKREQFAAMAMQGTCANSGTQGDIDQLAGAVAECAVKMADALLAELEKTNA